MTKRNGIPHQSEWTTAADEASHVAALEKEIVGMRARLGLYESIKTIPSHVIPQYRPKATGGAIALALLSDCHWEERVDPKDVPGTYNMYNPAIAKKRAEQFAQRVVYVTEAQRHLTPVNDLCLAILGDLITGHLHEDNQTNFLFPLQAVLLAMDLCNSIIDYILQHGKFDHIIIPCVFGNHGRLTRKPPAKIAPETNLEFMLYQLLAKHWAKEPRLTFHVADGLMMYLDLAEGKTVRFMHGDHVRYEGGTGGLYVPMHRAIYRLNQTKQAFLTCFGHFHTACDLGFAIGNGSMIGPNAYSTSKQIPYERPTQQYLLIDSKRGKSLVANLFCDYLPQPDDKLATKNPW